MSTHKPTGFTLSSHGQHALPSQPGRTLGSTLDVDDFKASENSAVTATCYVICSLVNLAANTLVIYLLLKSKRMVKTPKYWPVLVTSAILWLQGALSNPQMIISSFESMSESSCHLWEAGLIYNKYVCVSILCWMCFVLHLDYFLCGSSASYRRRYRPHVTIACVSACVLGVVASTAVLVVRYGSVDTPWTSLRCHFSFDSMIVNNVLPTAAVYGPLSGCIVFTLLALIFRLWSGSHRWFRHSHLNLNSFDVQGLGARSGSGLPLDHFLFLLALLTLCLPSIIIDHLMGDSTIMSDTEDTGSSLGHLASAVAIMRDCAGMLIPLSWFCFTDMCIALKHLPYLRNTLQPSDSAFEETSEFKTYDSYPYCSSVEL